MSKYIEKVQQARKKKLDNLFKKKQQEYWNFKFKNFIKEGI